MRTRDQFLTEYARSHVNPLNKVIHMFCVPAIFFATGGIGWCIPIGKFLGLPPDVARLVNVSTLIALPILFFYARLGPSTLLTGLVWMMITLGGCLVLDTAGLPLLAISAWWSGSWPGSCSSRPLCRRCEAVVWRRLDLPADRPTLRSGEVGSAGADGVDLSFFGSLF